jgi:hypothetical protein
VHVAVGAVTTQATVLEPIVFPTVYVAPSVGVSVTTEVVRRNTMIDPRSASAGLVQETDTCVLPAVTLEAVTLPGDKLSIVTVVPPLSDPACALVPVHAVIAAVTA